MKLPSVPLIINAYFSIFQRFPLVMLVSVFGTIDAMLLIEQSYQDDHELYIKILLTAILGIPSLLAAAIIAEKWQMTGYKKWLPSLVAIGLLCIYYLTLGGKEELEDVNTAFRFTGFMLTAHLIVAFVAYLDKTSLADFWTYNKNLFSNFLVGAFYSLVVYCGLSLAILAVDNLFNLKIDGEIYGHLFVIVVGVVNTGYFLANFPKIYEGLSTTDNPYLKVFLNFTKFILIPIVIIYFLILYAYSLKILTTWELPKGWVSSLVLGFSFAGGFTYLLNYYLTELEESKIIRLFKKWFFYVLLPVVILLFIALYRRIDDYGITESRYIVAIAGTWLFVVSLYFIFSKKDNIKFIPLSMAAFAIFALIGPLNMFNVSKKNQIGRLELLLKNNNLLEKGKAVAAVDTLSAKDAENISSILYYLEDHGYEKEISDWFTIEESEGNYWASEAIAFLKIDENISAEENNYCNFNFSPPLAIEVGEFEMVMIPTLNEWPEKKNEGWDLRFFSEQGAFELSLDGEIKDVFPIDSYVHMLSGKYKCQDIKFAEEDASHLLAGEEYEMKLLTKHIDFRRQDSMQTKVYSWDGTCLIRKLP